MKNYWFIVFLLIFRVYPAFSSDLPEYDVKWYFLDLQVNDSNTVIKGRTQILVHVVSDNLQEMILQLTDSLQVDSVFVNDMKHGFVHADDTLLIPLSPAPARGMPVKTVVYYHGKVPTGGFFSAMTSKEDADWHQRVTWTLSEPFAAKEWFPCKQDLGDKADSCAVWVTVARGLVAGSNGVLEGVDTLEDGSLLRYRWHHHHPIDYYLISLAVSGYRTYDLYAHPKSTQDSVLIKNLVYQDAGYLDAEKEKIDQVVPALELYSELYGLYPFADEKYGHCLAPMGGGMEHQTMTTLDNFGFDMVVHELAHQWFGDHVTCASWQDIWINEGFASYSEYISRENLKSKEDAAGWMSAAQARAMKEADGSVYVPLDEINDVYRIFDYNLSYKKGAAILHMLRYELHDDSLFFDIFQSFQQEYADSVATGKDFEKVVEERSGMDFSDFFDQWYYGRGFPRFSFSWYQNHDSLFIRSVQTPSGSTPLFKMHIDFLIASDEGDTVVRLYQDRNNRVFALPLKATVWKVTPDPDKWLLLEISSVSHVISAARGDKDVILYPNPASGMVRVYLSFTLPGLTIKILNIDGKILRTYTLTAAPYRLNVSALSSGLYILKISSGNKKWVKKLVIRR
ncbi:MAG: T9SS type A sorting domain-containing protein [Bacteroidales bacterium]|nr:T9SS type A sorting domain-containing protein [Bacteroidales bacterium]